MSKEEYREYKEKKERKNKRRGSEIRSHRDKRIPPNVKCFICNGNHYKYNCPKFKEAKKVINMLTEEELNAIFTEDQRMAIRREYTEVSSSAELHEINDYSSDSSYFSAESNDDESINLVAYSDTTRTCCGSDCTCAECLNCIYAFSIKDENEYLKAILATEDPFARNKLKEQYFREQGSSSKQQEKSTSQIDPRSFMHVSVNRNTAQFRNQDIPEFKDFRTVARAMKALEDRVSDLEAMKKRFEDIEFRISAEENAFREYEFNSPMSNKSHRSGKQPETQVTSPNQESALFHAIMVQSNLIRIGIRIAERDMVVIALVDTGASINAIHPNLVPFDQRYNSVITSLSTVGGDLNISKEAPFTMYIDQKHILTLPMSAVLHDKLSTDIFLGLPFLSAVKPYDWEDRQGINHFWFTFQKRKFYYKI